MSHPENVSLVYFNSSTWGRWLYLESLKQKNILQFVEWARLLTILIQIKPGVYTRIKYSKVDYAIYNII